MPEPIDPGLSEIASRPGRALSRRPGREPRPAALPGRPGVGAAPLVLARTTAVAVTTAAVLAAVLIFRPAAPANQIERIVYVHDQPPPPLAAPKEDKALSPNPPEPAPPEPYRRPQTPYTRLEDKVLRWGLDGLDEPPPPLAPPDTLDSLLKSL